MRGGSVLCVSPSPQPSALSFSLVVFCLLGGRLETALYIHFTRRWVKSTRHSSAHQKSGKGTKSGNQRHSSQLAVLWGRFANRTVQLTDSASPGPAPSRVAYTASPPPRLSRPPLRLSRRAYAGRETEQFDALCLQKCAATASTSLSMKGVRPAGSVWGLMQDYIAGDGYSLSSGLNPCRI
jgi:hypothetical protein